MALEWASQIQYLFFSILLNTCSIGLPLVLPNQCVKGYLICQTNSYYDILVVMYTNRNMEVHVSCFYKLYCSCLNLYIY